MALCELLGAEPYISGNVGSGTVREMSEWAEYLTRDGDSPMARLRRANGREGPWRVRYWGIGNETWGCGGNMRAEYFADLARQYATYCRDHGDNELYRIASGASDEDYDIFHRHAARLVMTNNAQTVNVAQAMVLTDGDALVPTPTYHVFETNKGRQDATSLPVHLRAGDARHTVGDTELETVSVSASVKDGTLLVSLSNLDAEEGAEVRPDLRGGRIGEARARILTADMPQAHNTARTPQAVAPRTFDGGGVRVTERGLTLTLPPHSFVTVRAPMTVEG